MGEGAFGCCYQATSQDSSSPVAAIKAINKRRMKGSSYRNADKVRSEVALLQRCQSQRTVGYLGYSQDQNYHYVIMEYCEGRSLERVLRKRGKVTEPEARILLVQMVEMLELLQAKKVIHRE